MISHDKRVILESRLFDDSLFLLVGGKQTRRNGDVYYPFRQDSDMLLLSEVESPDIVLTCAKQGGICEWKIFSDPLSDHEKLWGTERLSYAQIAEVSGISAIMPLATLEPYISSISENIAQVYASPLRDNPYLSDFAEREEDIHGAYELMEPLRLIKTGEEIDTMRKAISITHKAYDAIRNTIKPGMYEYEIEAIVASIFRAHHATEAYPTIVATGANACTLHYTAHTDKLVSGDLVLVDFGSEYHGYASDITRVFPVGMISERQRQVYESVKRVKEFATSTIRPGVKKTEYEAQVRSVMNKELEKLGLIPRDALDDVREKLSRTYYPHSTSHFLGLDVHDVGSRDATFIPGMVITCEPGIYIREENIGIRLEDDILVTENGCENLSEEIPVTLE